MNRPFMPGNPFPTAIPGGRVITDELCRCGHRRSAHGHTMAWGHGRCVADFACTCERFTWRQHVIAPGPSLKVGAIVSLRGWQGRKVGVILEHTRDGFEIAVWMHNSRAWTKPRRVASTVVKGAAPAGWPMTRAAAAAWADGDRP